MKLLGWGELYFLNINFSKLVFNQKNTFSLLLSAPLKPKYPIQVKWLQFCKLQKSGSIKVEYAQNLGPHATV